MANLIFDEQQIVNDSIFKFENRLKSNMTKYLDGMTPSYTTYFCLNENSSTTDRWLNDVDKLFGKRAPLRYNQIKSFPLYGVGQVQPNNTDEQQLEDITMDGEAIILPSTLIPHPNDFFMLDMIQQPHLFQVTNVERDTMRPEGYYKIHYRLQTTSFETIQSFLQYQVIGKFVFDQKLVGTTADPVIAEEEAGNKTQIQRMLNEMIRAYRALFYNERHNCFLYHDEYSGLDWFDMCGNEFMAKYGLMNYANAGKVIVLHSKLKDVQFPIRYQNSVFAWLEIGASVSYFRKFHFMLVPASSYPYSSFVQWGDDNVQVIHPLGPNDVKLESQYYSYFDEAQFKAFTGNIEPINEYEKLIWKYMHNGQVSLEEISVHIADSLLSSNRHRDIYLYTPLIIYIIRDILGV